MKVTWYGTASIGLDDGKTKLLIDPFIRTNKTLDTPMEDFMGADAILVTHGHFDHIYSIPEIMQKDKRVTVYCTRTPADTLMKNKVSPHRIHPVAANETFKVGDFTVKVYPSRHVTFDFKYIMSVFGKCAVKFPMTFWMEYLNLRMPENDETVTFEIENNGKRVVIMGSFGTVENVEYPKEPDLFILPYGGCTKVPDITRIYLDYTRPKNVLISHYDNAFPPLTRRMPAEKLAYEIMARYDGVKCIVPKERRAYEI